ncbi:MAG: carboxypeptidase regulatory-like domain-containing protein [Planctomycetota bacterium JB042]
MNRSSSSPALPFVLLLAGLGAGAAWLLTGEGDVADTARPSPVVDAAGVDPPRPDPAAASTPGVTRSAEPTAGPARGSAASLVGRVAFPAGAPDDPTLAVVALGAEPREFLGASPTDRSWDRRPVLARADVAADGTFSLSLPADAPTEVALDVDGTFLFLEEPAVTRIDTLGGEPAVLEPALGGAIRGTLELPPGIASGPAVAEVGAFGTGSRGAGLMRATRFEGTLAFEIPALPSGLRYALWGSFDVFPGVVRRDGLTVAPGAWTDVRLPMQAGAVVRGRVVDADGEPIARAEIQGDVGASFSVIDGAGRTSTDDDGRFELRGLTVRPQSIAARAEGFLDGESERLDLVEGGTHDGVRIALETGEELRGTVVWSDGSPAVDAKLIVIPLDGSGGSWRLYERTRSEEGTARSAADGTFRVPALEPGAYGVFAESPRASDPADARATWCARAASVAAGTTDLVLTLAAPPSLPGLVVDDEGTPIDAFSVAAYRAEWPGWADGPSKEVSGAFAEAGGRFALAGVDAGDWFVSIRADGHLGSESRRVTVAVDGSPVGGDAPFVLTRTGLLSGVVLDPDGRPVAGAHVRAAAQDSPASSDAVRSDAEGRFVLASVGPGAIALTAGSDDWAPSVEEFVELSPGDRREEHVVRLTRGGALTGVVYDANGAPDPSRWIVLQSSEGDVRELESDAAGRFRAAHLAPGAYQVIATPDDESASSDDPSRDVGGLFGDLRMTMATVVEGETVEVALGLPPRAPVVVAGRVTHGGHAVPDAQVLVLAERGAFLEGMRGAAAGEDGRYEVTLDAPGDHTFVVLSSPSRGAEVDFQVTVPEVERYRLDLALPGGSIAGVVRTADGAAPSSAVVWLRREDGTSDLSAMMSGGAVVVEDDGSFVIETLHPGRYAITATGPEHGITTRHDVVVSDGARTGGIEVRLSAAGRLEGVVRDEAGAPTADATISLRDRDGRPLHRISGTTGHDGSFSIDRVPAGELFVTARTRERVGEPVRTRVAAGETGSLDLSVRPGTVLRVAFEGEDGAPTRAALRVEDEEGRDRAGGRSAHEIESLAAEGLLSSERRVGPLPPGTYVVRARTADGRAGEASVTLSAQRAEETVTIRLSEG